MSDLSEKVALMRSLGVVRWGDIVLGPEPRPVSEPATRTPRKLSPELTHEKFWAQWTRSSGAKTPPCSPGCACGAGRRKNGDE